jgi:hypothetical protein
VPRGCLDDWAPENVQRSQTKATRNDPPLTFETKSPRNTAAIRKSRRR